MPGYSLALVQQSGHEQMVFSLARSYRSGAYVSGVWKMAQNFVAELLTQRGSVRFDPLYGSRFTTELRGYNMLSVGELRGALARGINDVVTNMRGRERISDRADEMLASAEIVRLDQELDSVLVALQLTSEAGRVAVIKLPIPFLNPHDA